MFVLGSPFLLLSGGSLYASVVSNQLGGLVPATVFLVVGFACLVVAFYGSDKAVAQIWKNK